ncbi:Mitochondrial distribution and morphology protein 10 [Coemansia aciculifera]|uniref:Mitochondrial distribution and morphology protein 10 n=1 Tax=Coemansia aciculifera TaxID=417176 RepID=A0ACC1M7H6_9FUNG|nr:Mitochondrial distribution and morphology protein 10 [Coemansia aciculifera]KAJ2910651.1 Mitochondrial distribution and morphology protein 10 [Coemansia aciculifera]
MVFTSPDYFPFLARKFHQATRWDDCNSYATFCKTSQAILDFSIPYGLSVSTGRSVSNSLSSQLVFSMIPRRASSIGYLASSRPLFALPAKATAATAAGENASVYNMWPAPVDVASADAPSNKNIGSILDPVSGIDPDPQAEAVLAGFSPSQPSSPLGRSDTLVHAAASGGSGDFAFVRGQQVHDEQVSSNLLHGIRSGIWKCNWDIGNPSRCRAATNTGDYLLLAQMYPSLSSMTGSYTLRRSETSELVISGVSVAGTQPDLQLVVQHAINKRQWSGEAMFGTSGGVFGLRGQYNFGDVEALDEAAYAYYRGSDEDAKRVARDKTHGRFSLGSEVYYGAQDASGGISVGARYRYDLPLFSELTCVLNPIMGHLSLAWTQQLRPSICTAARYDFNVFSLNSELAAGVEWQLDRNSMVKARWSGSQGLRFLADTRVGNMVFSVGLALNSEGLGAASSPASSLSSSSSAGIKRLVQSFGLQLQWFL